MDKKIKTIHDVFKLGSRAVINNQDYQLEEIMIWGTAEIIYTILRFIAKNGKNIVVVWILKQMKLCRCHLNKVRCIMKI